MTGSLVLDDTAVTLLAQANIEEAWFEKFEIGSQFSSLKRKEYKSNYFIINRLADENIRVIVIPLVFLHGLDDVTYGFDHILRVALSFFDRRISIPVAFHQFNFGSKVSVYGHPSILRSKQRIYFERNPEPGSKNLYVYNITDGAENIDDVNIDFGYYKDVMNCLVDVLVEEVNGKAESDPHGISLVAPLSTMFVGSANLNEWYEKRLTQQQRSFVDKEINHPVRLKGAAGTGKTLSLVIKCIRELRRFSNNEKKIRIAFVTHSYALAHDVVRNMLDALDPQLRDVIDNEQGFLWLGSLYELIQDIMGYERKGLKPLSLDGYDGREFQKLVIEGAVRNVLSEPAINLILQNECSEEFLGWLELERRPRLVIALSIEFGAILDADGVRFGNAAAKAYMRSKREPWQLPAVNEMDREIILRIHDKYCVELDDSRTLSMDQMVADFSRYLEATHEWRQLRDVSGFDLIFVDELHYFNNMERMTFHRLFRADAVRFGNCPLFSAQDVKQSTNDVFISKVAFGLNVGQSEFIEFTKIFRYTGAIAKFLHDLDGAFPALGLNDWSEVPILSEREEGERPVLLKFPRQVKGVDYAFQMASDEARKIGGKNVVILSTDEKSFDEYVKWGRLDGLYTLVSGRDALGRIRYAGRKPIFSMPDYVAGLQFNTVIILDAEQFQDGDDRTLGERRRFVSRLYLGASRASDKLFFIASEDRGGAAAALSGALNSGRLLLRTVLANSGE